MEEWHSRGKAQESTVSMLLIATTDRGGTEQWTSGSLGDVPQVQKPALQNSEAIPPYIHPTSRYMYITAYDDFYQASPGVSTASNKR